MPHSVGFLVEPPLHGGPGDAMADLFMVRSTAIGRPGMIEGLAIYFLGIGGQVVADGWRKADDGGIGHDAPRRVCRWNPVVGGLGRP